MSEETNEKEYEHAERTISPSTLVIRRFMRNKPAIIGLFAIAFMFLFSFLGPLFSPYSEGQVFTEERLIGKELAGADTTVTQRFFSLSGEPSASLASLAVSAVNKNENAFSADGADYTTEKISDNFHIINSLSQVASFNPALEIISVTDSEFSFLEDFVAEISEATDDRKSSVEISGAEFFLKKSGKLYTITAEKTIGAVTPYVFNSYEAEPKAQEKLSALYALSGAENEIGIRSNNGRLTATKDGKELFDLSLTMITETSGVKLTPSEKYGLENAIKNGETSVEINGKGYTINGENGSYTIKQETLTEIISVYAPPSPTHLLGTDANGMDILTRLMYGGRVSLLIGFIVVFIEVIIGVLLGGIAGYFGGIPDNLIMRLVDIFNCIPTLPLFLILGAVMDGLKVEPQLRIYFLMLILGTFSWPPVARLVRGQILSLREQEFMIATEATGLSVRRRILKHLVPNVIPQLIVIATMGLGSIILMESTLSFFGLGVKYPFASWGNIINAVTSIQVMTSYLYVWIPAGLCILITVMGFNLAGDGLRDAFDPRMKR